jgi:hypothetical protein
MIGYRILPGYRCALAAIALLASVEPSSTSNNSHRWYDCQNAGNRLPMNYSAFRNGDDSHERLLSIWLKHCRQPPGEFIAPPVAHFAVAVPAGTLGRPPLVSGECNRIRSPEQPAPSRPYRHRTDRRSAGPAGQADSMCSLLARISCLVVARLSRQSRVVHRMGAEFETPPTSKCCASAVVRLR